MTNLSSQTEKFKQELDEIVKNNVESKILRVKQLLSTKEGFEIKYLAQLWLVIIPASLHLVVTMAEKSRTTSTPCLAAALNPTASSSKDGSTNNNGNTNCSNNNTNCSNNNNVARIQRNVAEKQRRDKLNGYISELATIVPMVSTSSKRLDKTSILRLSAAHLRICKSPLGGNKKMKKSLKWCPSFLTNDQMREILESVDGFLMVTTPTGKILFTSRSVERYLGHQDIDLIGHSLYTFIHPDDLDTVKEEMERLLLACMGNGTCRCSFQCRLKERAQPRSESITYQHVHFVGGMAIAEEDNDKASRSVVSHMFKAFVRVVDISPYNQLSLEEATADEYVTRHSLDGTIIFADHRLATITGHMPHEVVGLSAYEYIHKEDTSIALFAHHLMFSNDKGTGMIVYRLRTRDQRYVYLKSVGCLQYDSATSQVDHFVCVNQQLDDSDGDLQLKYFIDRYIPHIKGSSASSLFESVKALQISSSKSSPSNKMNGTSHSEDDSSSPGKIETNVSNKKTEARKIREKGRRNSKSEMGANSDQKICRKKRHSLPQPASPDFVNKNGTINPCSPDIPQNKLKIKRQNIGTIATNVNVNSDMEYFNDTVNGSNSEPVKDIYTSCVNSSMNVNQSDNVNTQSKSMLSSLLSEDSYSVTKGPNHHVHNNSSQMVLGSVKTCYNENGHSNLSVTGAEGGSTVQIGKQFPHSGVREKKKNGDRHNISENRNFFHHDYENQALSDKEMRGSISLCCSPMKDVFHSGQSGTSITDSNSLLDMQLGNSYEDEDIIHGNVDESFAKHSSFDSHSNCIDDIHPTLSVVNSNDSDSVLKNSRWSVDNCFKFQSDIEDTTTTSSMDYCDTMRSAEDEVNGELKDSFSFQDDLSSLLSSTLPHSDSNSLPSANGWNDIFSSTEYSSPLSNDDLLQKDDDQLLITNPKVKSYDLW
ncbi:aryl hydrocarbon receptor nuclear translocator-like protein 1 [Nephila pilipes]|uniref:Aryl hydrocarbon receptor nuclear translocator-like protein 1 n=1 Tax=Nephila pilipes TaxID=299642 RepID=A0A8X6TRE4_NEPPI|nr:aryl hydrocarbon receptor nuclear translocator-like protein 1 [Nephila pilipes]